MKSCPLLICVVALDGEWTCEDFVLKIAEREGK